MNPNLRAQPEAMRKMKPKPLIDALEAVLLFHSASPWTEENKTRWWNLTQSNEATTRVLCDCIRIRLGMLPSCFVSFVGKTPDSIPSDMPLNAEQRLALEAIKQGQL